MARTALASIDEQALQDVRRSRVRQLAAVAGVLVVSSGLCMLVPQSPQDGVHSGTDAERRAAIVVDGPTQQDPPLLRR